MDAPPDVRELLSAHPDVLEAALWLRALVLAAEPDFTERVNRGWGGLGYRHPEAGYVCGIFPREGEVRLLFEHGVQLDDPDGILEGDGTQTRHVTIRERDDRLAQVLARYVNAAVGQRLFRL
jgi:hypothetical protein